MTPPLSGPELAAARDSLRITAIDLAAICSLSVPQITRAEALASPTDTKRLMRNRATIEAALLAIVRQRQEAARASR